MGVKILAWDYSGSTDSMAFYFNHGLKYLKQFKEESEDAKADGHGKVVYLRWSSICEEMTAAELDGIISEKRGRGGTSPSTIIQWIKENIARDEEVELWLITDGEIEHSELSRCSQLNADLNYSQVKFIIINARKIDMSVGAAFFRGSKIQIFNNEDHYKTINTSQPFDYNGITVENLDSRWDSLSDFVQAKFMGSDLQSLEEVDKLNCLRKRLLGQVSKDVSKEKTTPTFSSKNKADLIDDLKSCKFYRTLTNAQTQDIRLKIDTYISTLVNYIHNKNKSCTFDSLKVDYRQNKMEEVGMEAEPEMDSLENVENCSFYDAITLDMEIGTPVLLLNKTDLIDKYWLKGNYSKFRTVVECPLTAKIDESIGHVYLLETFKSLIEVENENSYEEYTFKNPMTNQPVFGGLVFSPSADRWNDFVLSKSFFRGKKLSTNFPLWYYIIWKHAQNVEWIDQSVKDQLKSYAFRRLETAKVKLTFSSLPLDPKEIVPLPIACFYCTEGSSILFGQHPTLFLHERLRMYYFVADYMLEILEHFGYSDVDAHFVKERGNVFSIMNIVKKIPKEIDKRYFLLENIFEKQGKFLTWKVKNRKAFKYLHLLNYNHKHSMIPFQYDITNADFQQFVLLSYEYEDKFPVALSLNTFRPFFVVDTGKNEQIPYYKQLIACLKSVTLTGNGEIEQMKPAKKIEQKRLISGCKYFIDAVNVLEKYPSFQEYLDFVAKVKKIHENTLIRLFPIDIEDSLKATFEFYASSSANIPVQDFIKKTQASLSIESRIEIENKLKETDRNNFIEEAKKYLA